MNPINTALTPFINLEDVLADEWMVNVDIHYDCGFEDYLEPNEEKPEGIKEHLDLAEEGGIIVSTGTQRCKTGPLLGRFEAVVMRDINHRTKAYNDFDILLLKLSEGLKEYQELSAPIPCCYEMPLLERVAAIAHTHLFPKRIEILSKKLKNSSIKDNTRQYQYYKKYLHHFASIYLSQKHAWRNNSAFKALHFHENESQFLKLQEYAKSGSMISTIGSINDLFFLKKFKVSAVDTSNIWNYIPLNIQGLSSPTRLIVTEMGHPTEFYSCIHVPFSEGETIEFNQLFDTLVSCYGNQKAASRALRCAECNVADPFNISSGSIYSRKTIPLLRDYLAKNVITIPGFEPVDMKGDLKKLNTCTALHIEKMCEHPNTKRFLDDLVNSWRILLPSAYIGFSKMEDWKQSFEKKFLREDSELAECLLKLQKAGVLAEFIQHFGHERMDALLIRCSTIAPFFEEEWRYFLKAESLSIASIL